MIKIAKSNLYILVFISLLTAFISYIYLFFYLDEHALSFLVLNLLILIPVIANRIYVYGSDQESDKQKISATVFLVLQIILVAGSILNYVYDLNALLFPM